MLHRMTGHVFHTGSQDSGTVSETPMGVAVESHPSLLEKSDVLCGGRSAAAELGQEVGHAEEDPHHQEVGAEGQEGQRVQQAGVQPEVTHRQQPTQVLLDHPLPRTNAAGGRRGREEEDEEEGDEDVVVKGLKEREWASMPGRVLVGKWTVERGEQRWKYGKINNRSRRESQMEIRGK